MRKLLLLLIITLIVSIGVWAKNDSPFGSQYDDTNLALRVAVGANPGGIAVCPGVEFIYTQIEIGDDIMPLDLGAMAEGYLGIGEDFAFGAGVYGTGHLGLQDIDIEIVENFDIFLGIGLGFVNNYGITFAGVSGISYFLNPNMSLFLEYNYLSTSNGCLGVQLHY